MQNLKVSRLASTPKFKIVSHSLTAMGIDLSLVCPFKPVLIGYKTNSRSKLTTPLSAYALSHAVGDQGGKDAWKEQADKVKKVNKANKLADYVAFPRFVASRKVNAKGPLPSAKPVHMMASFKAEKFTLVMNASELSLQIRAEPHSRDPLVGQSKEPILNGSNLVGRSFPVVYLPARTINTTTGDPPSNRLRAAC